LQGIGASAGEGTQTSLVCPSEGLQKWDSSCIDLSILAFY